MKLPEVSKFVCACIVAAFEANGLGAQPEVVLDELNGIVREFAGERWRLLDSFSECLRIPSQYKGARTGGVNIPRMWIPGGRFLSRYPERLLDGHACCA